MHRIPRIYRGELCCRYDTFITVYMSDCDFYPRVRSAGWKTLQYSDFCPDMSPRVCNLFQHGLEATEMPCHPLPWHTPLRLSCSLQPCVS